MKNAYEIDLRYEIDLSTSNNITIECSKLCGRAKFIDSSLAVRAQNASKPQKFFETVIYITDVYIKRYI